MIDMDSKIGIIIRREYMERVSKKSFLIVTILMPLFMLAMMVLPVLIMELSTPEIKTIAVVDSSGLIAPNLKSDEEVRFVTSDAPSDSLKKMSDYFGVLTIDSDIMSRPTGVKLFSPEAVPMGLESTIRSQMNKILEDEKLKSYNIEDLDSILSDIRTEVVLQTFRTDDKAESEEAQSGIVSYALGTGMMFILYMFLLMYGSMVMTSIIEEKNNRVLEIVVSSISPTQLMMGKIVGVGLVAVTQVLIWLVLITAMSGILLPAIVPVEMMQEATALNAGTLDPAMATLDMDLAGALGILSDVGYLVTIFTYLLLFLIGGFLFYAAIFAAIGSAVDNIQDASQLQTVAVIPVLIGLIGSMAVVNEPNSVLAVVLSLVPFTSPMVMMTRIPFGIASWEIVVSLLLLYVSFVGMVWVAAKIYRVGIFMYGKKPTLRELIRWARYK